MTAFPGEFHALADGLLRISQRQASRFAKEIAGDWNPIHDEGSRRFCVPGDLLFAVVLARYGLSRRMLFNFKGMVGADVPLVMPPDPGERFALADASGKVYLEVDRGGPTLHDQELVEAFTRCYVAFSGRNFPHYLKPLMAEKGVMFNPERPLVIYDQMGFELDLPGSLHMDLDMEDARLDVVGKRAVAHLHFSISADGVRVGGGEKQLTISGLQPYDEDRLQSFINEFTQRIAAYSSPVGSA